MEITIDSRATSFRDASCFSDVSDELPLVEVKDEAKIQVHPREEGETIAILPYAVPHKTIAVKATVCTEHDHASTIEYAMAVIEVNSNIEARQSISETERSFAHSGWHRVEKQEIYEIDLKLPNPTNDSYHLVLATRLPDDGYKQYGWARWYKFQFVTEAGTSIEQPPSSQKSFQQLISPRIKKNEHNKKSFLEGCLDQINKNDSYFVSGWARDKSNPS